MAGHRLDFDVGGAQKSGTSTLDAWLRLHPDIQMSRVKETHFFDDESRNWAEPDYEALDRFFVQEDRHLRGESTPASLYWHPALPRLARYRPDLKLVLLLRNPIERAHSHWQMERSRNCETLDFPEAIRTGRKRIASVGGTPGLHRVFSYVERGFYARQLAHVAAHFPREQIHCETFETFFARPLDGLGRIAKFLGLPSDFERPPPLHLNAARDQAYRNSLSAQDREYLAAVFRDDVACLRAFLGRDLSEWPDFAPAKRAEASRRRLSEV